MICSFLLLTVFCNHIGASPAKSGLPIVDLGYELHQANSYNVSGSFYNFSNIRYAAPPLGPLRFAAPQPPPIDRSQIQTGSTGRICPQAGPSWEAIQGSFVSAYLTGRPFNASAVSSSNTGGSSMPSLDPRTTEDCLFLDILVPKKILDGVRRQHYGRPTLAPVMVWIYGGGYTAGEKSTYDGAPFLRTSDNGVIYVAINYRLGAFGWSSGPTFQSEGGTANAGLRDQRFALEWVQRYIHLFGGDRDRVMIFGESAGGGSVMHQVTAYGGERGPVPFQAALPQSPGFLPVVSAAKQERTYKGYLELLKVNTIEEARQLPSSALITANLIQVASSPYGQFTYGPVVDGVFVPALPGQLLSYGAFDSRVRIMTGHNADEGLDFTPYYIQNDTAARDNLEISLPDISKESLDFVLDTLYPPVYDGSLGYHDQIARVALQTSELSFTCNDNYLARAFKNRTYAYKFSMPPALHGQDVPYTFDNGGGTSSGVQSVTVAHIMQEFITSFAITGHPSSPTWGQQFPEYGSEANIVNLNVTSITVEKDDTANPRCYWWQKGLFY
ncbi:alpha/beta-hydrolase [Rhizodiscina lignyota]|uniref:Carboxylic ester hydrolase n=1 Tax=Rhizodiscina lignyota TaxID=1504668 RepID=A0A9P4IEK6_9PEZI|nr:alpha/beta-hydrolase [Rhizodiscina lignyota]